MTSREKKLLVWLGNSLDSVRSFSAEARREAGNQLGLVRVGREPSNWKLMESVGAGVREIRIHAETGYRILYVAKFSEAVYVLHGFEKKTQRTPRTDTDLSKKRYRELLTERMRE